MLIIILYQGKGDELEKGNYRSLKIPQHWLKMIKRVMEKIACELVSIDELQFGFVPGRGTTDAIFSRETSCQRKESVFYLCTVDLQKPFDCLAHNILWWAILILKV